MAAPVPSETKPELPRALTVLLGLAALVVCLAGARALGGTLGPAFLALVLVVTVHPLHTWLRRKGWPGWLCIMATLVTLYAMLLATAAALAWSVAELANALPEYSEQFTGLMDDLNARLLQLGIGEEQIRAAMAELNLSRLVGVLGDLLSGLSSVLSDLLFVVTLILFLCADAARFTHHLNLTSGARPALVESLASFAHGTRRYMVVATVFGLIVAVIDVGALYLLAIPLPLLWGLLAFITNYIPNIGFVLGVVPPALLGLLEGGIGLMVWVVVAYSVINVVIQSFIQPKVVGDAVGLSMTMTFLSLVFWTFVLGPLGAILAVPLTLLVKALLIDADPTLHWLRPLLGDGPKT